MCRQLYKWRTALLEGRRLAQFGRCGAAIDIGGGTMKSCCEAYITFSNVMLDTSGAPTCNTTSLGAMYNHATAKSITNMLGPCCSSGLLPLQRANLFDRTLRLFVTRSARSSRSRLCSLALTTAAHRLFRM